MRRVNKISSLKIKADLSGYKDFEEEITLI